MKIEPAEGERISVVLGDRTLTMPAALREALRFAGADGSFAVRELDAFFEDAASGLAFARRLAREGVLEILAP
jgi:bifunctional lysine-specific demethylase and histidyl-hydroxylase NO66